MQQIDRRTVLSTMLGVGFGLTLAKPGESQTTEQEQNSYSLLPIPELTAVDNLSVTAIPSEDRLFMAALGHNPENTDKPLVKIVQYDGRRREYQSSQLESTHRFSETSFIQPVVHSDHRVTVAYAFSDGHSSLIGYERIGDQFNPISSIPIPSSIGAAASLNERYSLVQMNNDAREFHIVDLDETDTADPIKKTVPNAIGFAIMPGMQGVVVLTEDGHMYAFADSPDGIVELPTLDLGSGELSLRGGNEMIGVVKRENGSIQVAYYGLTGTEQNEWQLLHITDFSSIEGLVGEENDVVLASIGKIGADFIASGYAYREIAQPEPGEVGAAVVSNNLRYKCGTFVDRSGTLKFVPADEMREVVSDGLPPVAFMQPYFSLPTGVVEIRNPYNLRQVAISQPPAGQFLPILYNQ
ncbi:hypothetical protein HY468_03500 [Candidatus Roizmanbacteria bacterium]|nr:hypothetical protein [Candidatus Roizmanbacteria bacterium]